MSDMGRVAGKSSSSDVAWIVCPRMFGLEWPVYTGPGGVVSRVA